ncbi:TetR/AcrR family transcriptional regulator [Aliamphritea spongicola]
MWSVYGPRSSVQKQQLLDTARRVFAENGYQGTSIDLIVQEAGVSSQLCITTFRLNRRC